MKLLLLAAAVVGLSVGCAQGRILGGLGQAGHVIRSQRAPRPGNLRSACGGDCGEVAQSCGTPSSDSFDCGDGCDSSSESCGASRRGLLKRFFARRGQCDSCGGRGCGLCSRVVGGIASGFCPHSGGYPESYNNYNPSPPTGQTAYPYYTVRGPRDFLQKNPSSIGPY